MSVWIPYAAKQLTRLINFQVLHQNKSMVLFGALKVGLFGALAAGDRSEIAVYMVLTI